MAIEENWHPISQPKDFWNNVNKISNSWSSDCWLWTGWTVNGYGYVTYQKTRWLVHRLSWTLEVGDIKHGLFVLHNCINRNCVNPNHLYLGTQKENMQDAKRGGIFSPSAKLSLEEVYQIREKLKQGLSQRKIAKMFNISPGAIQKIAEGRSW